MEVFKEPSTTAQYMIIISFHIYIYTDKNIKYKFSLILRWHYFASEQTVRKYMIIISFHIYIYTDKNIKCKFSLILICIILPQKKQ